MSQRTVIHCGILLGIGLGAVAGCSPYDLAAGDLATAPKMTLVEVARFDRLGGVLLPDGSGVVTISTYDGTVRLLSTQTGEVIRQMAGEGPKHCQTILFSQDGSTVAAKGCGPPVYVWDLATGQLRGTFQPDPYHPGSWDVSYRISADGTYLSLEVALAPEGNPDYRSASGPRTLIIWNTRTGQEAQRLAPSGSAGFSYDGRFVAAHGRDDNVIRVWAVETGELVRQFSTDPWERSRSSYVNVATPGGWWAIIVIPDKSNWHTITNVVAWALTPYQGKNQDRYVVIDMLTGEPVSEWYTPGMNWAGYSNPGMVVPEGPYLLKAYSDPRASLEDNVAQWRQILCLYDIRTGELIGRVDLPDGAVVGGLSANGRVVVTRQMPTPPLAPPKFRCTVPPVRVWRLERPPDP